MIPEHLRGAWQELEQTVDDYNRSRPKKGDPRDITLARKYLAARDVRKFKEEEDASRLDIFSSKVAEIIRAKRFANIEGINLESRNIRQIEDAVLQVARDAIDQCLLDNDPLANNQNV